MVTAAGGSEATSREIEASLPSAPRLPDVLLCVLCALLARFAVIFAQSAINDTLYVGLRRLQLRGELIHGAHVIEVIEIGVSGQRVSVFPVDQNLHLGDARGIGRDSVD